MDENIQIGKYTLESLTTGMYSDPKIIYREYIQNSVDALEMAVQSNLIEPQSMRIDIIVDVEKEEFLDEEKKRNLYVAASRAKHKLDIIVNASQEEIDNIAEQISNSNIKNSIAKIATKLKVKPVSILDKE